MARLQQHPFGFSPELARILSAQVGGIPPDVNTILGGILNEVGLNIAPGNVTKTRRLVPDDQAGLPRFFVEIHASLPDVDQDSTIPSEDRNRQMVSRQDFHHRAEAESIGGRLRIEVKPPDRIAVINKHVEITGTDDDPLALIDCYWQYYCLPDEVVVLHQAATAAIGRIYFKTKKFDFTAKS